MLQHDAKVELRVGVALLGGAAKPLDGSRIVAGNAAAGMQLVAEAILRDRVAALGCRSVCGSRFGGEAAGVENQSEPGAEARLVGIGGDGSLTRRAGRGNVDHAKSDAIDQGRLAKQRPRRLSKPVAVMDGGRRG